ncbi:hypothetical protein LCGC14_0313700 [marine sediment metagenome]|uniref:HNH nuclease domain-containing protein n=1 Tax=marine sediment metagenome TaxID=412755 RepID=A0A0F9WTE7_9ZZZZ
MPHHWSNPRNKPSHPAEERFWPKVGFTEACWLWLGAVDRDGYGQFGLTTAPVTMITAHRYAYITWYGTIPDGLQIDHLCQIKNCVNPTHMELVTSGENTRRRARLKTHCKHGHRYTAENVYVNPTTGRRQCRVCQKARNYRRS